VGYFVSVRTSRIGPIHRAVRCSELEPTPISSIFRGSLTDNQKTSDTILRKVYEPVYIDPISTFFDFVFRGVVLLSNSVFLCVVGSG